MGQTKALYIYLTVVCRDLVMEPLTMESKVIPNDLAGFCVPISDTGLPYSTLL